MSVVNLEPGVGRESVVRKEHTMRTVALALAFGVTAAVSAPAQTRPLTLQDYYRVETVNGTAISPDGRTVVYVRTFIVEGENRRHSEIWVAPADGSAPPRRLTNPAFSATAPRWSPDGRLLAFTSRRRIVTASGPRDESVWFLRMDQAGGEAFQIPGVESTPVFSPDNKWIAFTRAVPPARAASSSTNGPSEAERRIEERFKGRMYDWMNARFDGRGYLPDPRDPHATPPEEVFLVSRDGGDVRQLTSLGVNAQGVAWRPDSGALAFAANVHQRDEHTYERADLFTVDLAGAVKRITDDGYDHGTPAWTANGEAIVAIREQSLNQILASRQQHGSPTDLYRFPTAGGTPVNLTAAWDLIPGPPRPSPDGRHVYFTAGTAGTTQLFRVPVAGGAVEQVTRGDRRMNDVSIAWASNRMAFAASSPTTPQEAYVSALDGSAGQRLSEVNAALARDVTFRPAERLRFTSRDGTTVEGWLIMPEATAGERVPLVLAIHGGPHSAYGADFNFQFQLMAANGLAVLYTNPRGSTEYGEKFLWATWGGWGGLDYEDVMAGVDHVVARYPVDAKRLGVTGYSYGGFLTNWVITQTPRFAAAAVGAGISNWISDYGTADIPRTKESEFNGTPWEQKGAETLLKWSPVMRAGSVVTPTLFVHGESDLRVPIEQGEQMYTALRKRKVPAKFIRYPDSYHGGWTPWNTVHRYHHELQWWKQYLGRSASTSQ
jgi:dipeptidyl aminopeptidase/acylaminoacyl peptidase